MAQKAKGTAPVAVTALNSTGRSKIVASMRDAIGGVAKSGNLITAVCTCAISVAGGVKLSDTDTDAIMRQVKDSPAVQAMKPATRDSMLSRWRTVLGVYSLLPEATKQLERAVGFADWHNVMRLAVNTKRSKGNVAQAVKSTVAMITAKPGDNKPKTKAQALKAARRIVRSLLALPHMGREFQNALRSLAVKHEIMTAK